MIQRPKWLGGFYGGNLGLLNYEILTIQHIPRADLKGEAELMATKWFDYRRLHPLQATYYFAKCFNDAYRDFWRKSLNSDAAPHVRAFKEHDFLQSRQEKLTVWRLRRLLDKLGMRYDFFLNFAMNRHYRMVGEGGQIFTPRPGHFLSNEDLIADAMLAWEDQCQVSMQFARDSYYRVSNFNGSRDQLAYEAFVIQQIDNRQHKRFALSTALYKRDAVRVEEALRHFGSSLVGEAITEFSTT